MQQPARLVRGMCFGIALTLGLGLGAAAQVHAFEEIEAKIDYRQGAMRAIGGNMASLAAVIVDGVEDYRDNLALHARFIVDMSRDIPGLFPEGTDFGETNALPAIWENWERYEQLSEDTHQAAVRLLEAIEAGEANLGPRFREVGQSCTACHDDFRHRD
ncbi:cytochrome C [Thioalkalivibrio denitrificans]|uniref:Cytochrome C n=1 Tax=Thioalkalivibrio denitrificans TaxID=108003 RepID=A0A1V3NSZ9_9GAMM|nr:cytochrome c [Thioalkalivibrio denitrificans]OOG28134.1 cytochrome C [Thioalkalivibrio denitrificans]